MHNDESAIDTLWTVMHNEKGDLPLRAEEYARLTVPYLCPEEGTEGQEQDKGNVAIGPRLVNHLSNKVVDTMFPHDRPFFKVALTPEARKRLKEEMGEENEANFAEAIRTETAAVEEVAMRKIRMTAYRPQAVEAVKHMIVTGNSLIRRLTDGSRVVYGIKDFCVRRNVDGAAIEVMLRDAKKFGSLPQDIKQRVLNVHRDYKDDHDCTLYTHYKWDGNRWRMRQAVDSVVIDKGTRYKAKDAPFLPLTWQLARGENYGRGLVEDHHVAFHKIDVLSLAEDEMVGIMADIKFLVDPASVLDPAELNESARGSYHQGRKDDVTAPDVAKHLSLEAVRVIIDATERELAQAFLLNSSGVRDAERVTAEEIRFIARELESAFGGLYSRLALEWQKHEADYAVSQINFSTEIDGEFSIFEVLVTTGLESLSREGQLANMRLAIQDLQMLDGIPEDVRQTINPLKFANFVFTNHAVRMQEFMFTEQEMQANAEARMQQEQQLADVQANAKVREEAGKQAMKEK